MKPRYDAISYKATKLLEKAAALERRIEKAEKCPCGSGKSTAKCCPNLQKAQPGYKSEPSKDSAPHFVTETGGQTASQAFSTNQRTLESEDAPKPKNKKAKESVSMEGLGRKLNPHEGTGAEREDATGESKPLDLSKANPMADRREKAEVSHAPQICGACGGTTREGCRIHQGMDLNACQDYEPLQ